MTMASPQPEPKENEMEEMAPEVVDNSDPVEGPANEEDPPAVHSVDPDEFSPSGSFSWKIEGFSKISEKKIYSEPFVVGGHPWRILIFPKGNQSNFFSVYLDVGGDAPNGGWSRTAFFYLNIVNQKDAEQTIRKECQHRFSSKERDWGFTTYINLAELTDPSRGFLVDDCLILEAEVTVRAEDVKYDSKKSTGFVGLKNQGATCYMNSLLQTLFHLPSFRKAVYHMPTTEEDLPQSSIPLALQALFYKLQYSELSVPTNDLTKSFGWDTYDSFMQHDVQELNRVLCEKLEHKMKGTVVEGTIERLFEGHHKNYIECINVDYNSTRKESFYDLQLDVKNCKDVYASFDKYVEEEKLEGDNKYHAEQHGLQDAKKGVHFIDFPPVLQLQLKRFEYDFMGDMMVKINDRYEFPLELDLDREDRKYLSSDADTSVENKYTLHSVLVHSGGVHGGHYYAYIRPTLSSQWYKFDDDRVTKENVKRALDEQYGGDDDSNTGMNPQYRFAKFSNAYMLVYIRVSDIPKVFCQVDETDIAQHLLERMKQEQEEIARRRKDQAESHLYVYIKLARAEDLKEQIGKDNMVFDLVDHQRVRLFKVPLEQLFSDFMKHVEEEWDVPIENQRYWLWTRRGNQTYRPGHTINPEEQQYPVWRFLADSRDRVNRDVSHRDVNLYLEVTVPEKRDISKELLIFVKLYDPEKEELTFSVTIYVKSKSKVKEYLPEIRELVGFEPEENIVLFEELEYETNVECNLINETKAFDALEMKDGDIICVQKPVLPESTLAHPDIRSYFEYIKYRQVIHFRQLDKPKDDVFVVELSKLSPYDEVVGRLAKDLELENPSLLRLTAQNPYTQAPKPHPLKYRCFDNLKDVPHASNVIFYEVLDIPLPELEELKCLRLSFFNVKNEEEEVLNLRLPKKSSIKDLTEVVREKVKLKRPEAPLRVMELYNNKIYKVLKEDETVDTINDGYWLVRVEEVPEIEEEELSIPENRLVQVINFARDSNNSAVFHIGNPFFLSLKPEETLEQVKEKIMAKLEMSSEALEKLKLALVTTLNKVDYFEDGEVVGGHFQNKEASSLHDHALCIGLEHTDPITARRHASTQPRYSFEKAVKIHN